MYFQGIFASNPMPALDSVEVPELPCAWFAEGPEGAGRGSRNLPIMSYMTNHSEGQLHLMTGEQDVQD